MMQDLLNGGMTSKNHLKENNFTIFAKKIWKYQKFYLSLYSDLISNKNMCKWFVESNRWKHFVLGIPEGFLLTILFAAGTGTGMEFKDCHHDPNNANKPIWKWSWKNWDWLDWACTFAGGLVGQALQVGLILLLIKG